MKKIQLVIADMNIELLEYYTGFIRNSEFSSKFIVRTFSSKDKLIDYLLSNPEIDILLLDSNMDIREMQLDIYTIFLEEGSISEQMDFISIYKYQPLDQFFSKIIRLYIDKNQHLSVIQSGERQTKVISFYSAVGGAGKSTMAYNLAQQMTTFDKKVLYLNLELLSSTYHFYNVSGKYDFSKFLYYLKTNSKAINQKLEEYIQYDPITKTHYFEPCLNIFEILEMSSNDLQILINSLIEIKKFDYILIDLESSTHERIQHALKGSDLIFWLVIDDLQYLARTKLFLDIMKKRDSGETYYNNKILIIHNKYTGNYHNNFEAFGLYSEKRLPYIPEWKTVSNFEQLLSSKIYTEEIYKLFQAIEQSLGSESIC